MDTGVYAVCAGGLLRTAMGEERPGGKNYPDRRNAAKVKAGLADRQDLPNIVTAQKELAQ